MQSRPTRAGWIVLFMAFALAEAGALGGNNLVIAVAVVGWAAVLVDWVAGRRNLEGVEVSWRLPEELFANQGARGAFQVRNTRTRGDAREVEITDQCADATVFALGAGAEQSVEAWWRPGARGPLTLDGIRLRSRFPFGLLQHEQVHALTASCLVYPTPGEQAAWPGADGCGDGEQGSSPGGCGELLDLRPYRPGDRLGALHWRTSARTGRWLVVDRAREHQNGVRVRIDPCNELEAELRSATAAILQATTSGAPIALQLPSHPHLERYGTGTRWRRELLDALATYRP